MTHNPITEYLEKRLPSQPGFLANPVQVSYASAVGEALSNPGKIHFLEGDTGIGKSLAYLLSLSDWVARGKKHGRRGVVSTFSRSLQRQLLSPGNQAIIRDYLNWQELPDVSMGLRMGRQNYVSHERLALHLGVPSLEDLASNASADTQYRLLAQWALESEGCLLDLDPKLLPDHLSLKDIGLSQHEKMPEHLAEHFAQIRSQDILVINHALLALDLVNHQSITQAEEPYALLLDEAEHYPDAAESILSSQLSYRSTTYLLRRMGLKAALKHWGSLLESLSSPKKAGTTTHIPEDSRDAVMEGLKSLLRARPTRESYSYAIWDEWTQTQKDAEALVRRLSSTQTLDHPALMYSPVQGVPSLVSEAPSAGASLKAGVKARSTILTSATLSDMQHALGEPPSYHYIRGRILLPSTDTRIGLERSFQPLNFGQLTFDMPHDMPNPLYRDEEGRFHLSPTYAKKAVEHIAKSEGRVLVLCVSYDDVQTLVRYWPEASKHRLVTHRPGEALNDIANQLPDDGIFLTPSGWEGLSPDRSESAFWKRVVLLRNPNPAPSGTLMHFASQALIAKGKSTSEAHRIANINLFSRSSVQSAHKIRQGIGRAIRHMEDSVDLMILDPRFPRGDKQAAGEGMRMDPRLAGAIPHRFKPEWRKAAFMQDDGKSLNESVNLLL